MEKVGCHEGASEDIILTLGSYSEFQPNSKYLTEMCPAYKLELINIFQNKILFEK